MSLHLRLLLHQLLALQLQAEHKNRNLHLADFQAAQFVDFPASKSQFHVYLKIMCCMYRIYKYIVGANRETIQKNNVLINMWYYSVYKKNYLLWTKCIALMFFCLFTLNKKYFFPIIQINARFIVHKSEKLNPFSMFKLIDFVVNKNCKVWLIKSYALTKLLSLNVE